MKKALPVLVVSFALALGGCASTAEESAQSVALGAYGSDQNQSVGTAPAGELEESVEGLPIDLLDPTVVADPSIDMVTYYREKTEHWNRFSSCMEGREWPAPILVNPYTAHVSLRLEGWWDDRDRYVADAKECLIEAGPNPLPPVFTHELASKEYVRAQKAHACLIELGAPLPEFPSEQRYVDSFVIEKTPWTPLFYLNKDDLPQDMTIAELYERCPW